MKHARSFNLGICDNPKCRALHFELEDEHGRAFAQMNVGVDDMPRIIERMQQFAYEIVTTRGPLK